MIFEKNKLNPFPTLMAPLPLTFLLNLFIAFEANFLTNLGKLPLGKKIVRSVITFLSKLPNILPRNLLDWIVIDIWAVLS